MYEYYKLSNGNILLFKDHILICVVTNLSIIPEDWKEIKITEITGGNTNE